MSNSHTREARLEKALRGLVALYGPDGDFAGNATLVYEQARAALAEQPGETGLLKEGALREENARLADGLHHAETRLQEMSARWTDAQKQIDAAKYMIGKARDCERAEAENTRITEEHERLRRTVAFMENLYLREHGGSWGECRFQTENTRQREAHAALWTRVRDVLQDVRHTLGLPGASGFRGDEIVRLVLPRLAIAEKALTDYPPAPDSTTSQPSSEQPVAAPAPAVEGKVK